MALGRLKTHWQQNCRRHTLVLYWDGLLSKEISGRLNLVRSVQLSMFTDSDQYYFQYTNALLVCYLCPTEYIAAANPLIPISLHYNSITQIIPQLTFRVKHVNN